MLLFPMQTPRDLGSSSKLGQTEDVPLLVGEAIQGIGKCAYKFLVFVDMRFKQSQTLPLFVLH